MNRADYWDTIYRTRRAEQRSWTQARGGLGLAWIQELDLPPEAPVVDIGGGASSLCHQLLELGFLQLTVLDVSAAALEENRQSLTDAGWDPAGIDWLVGDILQLEFTRRYRLWHDRAVFHFLTDLAEINQYKAQLIKALEPEGTVILATFSPEGPEKCSGLPVHRYGDPEIQALFSPELTLRRSAPELHTTPSGSTQAFRYFMLTHA